MGRRTQRIPLFSNPLGALQPPFPSYSIVRYGHWGSFRSRPLAQAPLPLAPRNRPDTYKKNRRHGRHIVVQKHTRQQATNVRARSYYDIGSDR